MTPVPDLYTRLLRPLNEARVAYMVTGGLAAIIYGEPRLTNDVDVVVALATADVDRLANVFPDSDYYLPDADTIRSEAARRSGGHFNILDLESAVRADVYCLSEDPLEAWGMEHRRELPIGSERIWVAPIEYVIVQKLRYFRQSGSQRHLQDTAAMSRLSGDLIEPAVLSRWIEHYGLQREWQRVQSPA